MNEQEFSQKLAQLKSKAMKQGMCLSLEDIKETFGEMAEQEEQLGHLLAYFKSAKIAVGDEEEVEEFLSMEDLHYLDDYLSVLEESKRLEKDELVSIIKGAIQGVESAQEQLMNHYLFEVASLAKLYAGQGVLLEDLIGEGNLALTEAVLQIGCLDGEGDVLTEAEGFVGKYMMDAMEALINGEMSEKQADEEIAEKVNRVMDAARELSEDVRRSVTPLELAENSDLTLDEIYEAIRLSGQKIEEIDYKEE